LGLDRPGRMTPPRRPNPIRLSPMAVRSRGIIALQEVYTGRWDQIAVDWDALVDQLEAVGLAVVERGDPRE